MTENSMERITISDKDLSDKNEDNRYEPFTFELKPDRQYESDKAEQGSSSSASYSTDSEDDDDFIQLDTVSFANRFPNPAPSNGPGAISNMNPNADQLLFRPTSQPVFSTNQVETTNSSNVPAPQGASRIPSTIFTNQSKVPTEWSVASAESLFSLNFSNSSFTREYASLNNGLSLDSPTPTTPGSAISGVSDLSLEGFGGPLTVLEEMKEGENDEVVKENGVELGTDGGRLVNVNVSNSRRSDGSVTSMQSFAFPVYDPYSLILYLLRFLVYGPYHLPDISFQEKYLIGLFVKIRIVIPTNSTHKCKNFSW